MVTRREAYRATCQCSQPHLVNRARRARCSCRSHPFVDPADSQCAVHSQPRMHLHWPHALGTAHVLKPRRSGPCRHVPCPIRRRPCEGTRSVRDTSARPHAPLPFVPPTRPNSNFAQIDARPLRRTPSVRVAHAGPNGQVVHESFRQVASSAQHYRMHAASGPSQPSLVGSCRICLKAPWPALMARAPSHAGLV